MDELVIRKLNRDFISNASDTVSPGVYRNGSNSVGDFRTPDKEDVPGLMRPFAMWLKEDGGVHSVLEARIVHLHLFAIYPFWDCNGRTDRGLETLLLQPSPSGFRKLISTESVFLLLENDYLSVISKALGQEFSLVDDATPWLEFPTMVQKTGSDDRVARTTGWHSAMRQVHDTWATSGWPQRHVDDYAFAMRTCQMTWSDYMENTELSPATASWDLNDLVDVGVFRVEGRTRSRVYYPLDLEAVTTGGTPQEQLPLLVY